MEDQVAQLFGELDYEHSVLCISPQRSPAFLSLLADLSSPASQSLIQALAAHVSLSGIDLELTEAEATDLELLTVLAESLDKLRAAVRGRRRARQFFHVSLCFVSCSPLMFPRELTAKLISVCDKVFLGLRSAPETCEPQPELVDLCSLVKLSLSVQLLGDDPKLLSQFQSSVAKSKINELAIYLYTASHWTVLEKLMVPMIKDMLHLEIFEIKSSIWSTLGLAHICTYAVQNQTLQVVKVGESFSDYLEDEESRISVPEGLFNQRISPKKLEVKGICESDFCEEFVDMLNSIFADCNKCISSMFFSVQIANETMFSSGADLLKYIDLSNLLEFKIEEESAILLEGRGILKNLISNSPDLIHLHLLKGLFEKNVSSLLAFKNLQSLSFNLSLYFLSEFCEQLHLLSSLTTLEVRFYEFSGSIEVAMLSVIDAVSRTSIQILKLRSGKFLKDGDILEEIFEKPIGSVSKLLLDWPTKYGSLDSLFNLLSSDSNLLSFGKSSSIFLKADGEIEAFCEMLGSNSTLTEFLVPLYADEDVVERIADCLTTSNSRLINFSLFTTGKAYSSYQIQTCLRRNLEALFQEILLEVLIAFNSYGKLRLFNLFDINCIEITKSFLYC